MTDGYDDRPRPFGRLTAVMAVLAVLSVGAAAIPILIGAERMAAAVAGWATGFDVTIRGGVRLNLFGAPTVAAEDVILRLPRDRFIPVESPALLRVARAEADIDALALLRGALHVRRLVLERPALRLDRGTDGQSNWSVAGKPSLDPPAPAPGMLPRAARAAKWPRAEVAALVIDGGTLRYTDARLARDITFDGVNLDAAVGDAADGRVLRLRGEARHRSEPVYLEAELRRLEDFRDGIRVPFSLNLDAAPGSLAARGTVADRPRLAVTADIDLDVDAPDSLAQLLPLAPPALVARTSARLSLDVKGGRIAADLRTLALGGSDLSGKLSLDLDDRLPQIDLDLDAGVLQLPHIGAALRLMGFFGGEAKPASPTRFAVGGRTRLKWARLAWGDMTFEAGQAGFSWRTGESNLAAEVAAVPLLGGTLSGRAELTASEGRTALSLTLSGADIDSARVMTRFLGGYGLSGHLHGSLDLLAVGATPADLLAAASGGGKLALTDGRIFGSPLQQAVNKEERSLGLSRASMDFRIEGGVLKSDEVLLDFDVGHTRAALTCDLSAGGLTIAFKPSPLHEQRDGPVVVKGPVWELLLAR